MADHVKYPDWSFENGNVVALGGNLWSQYVRESLLAPDGKDELGCAARAFFDKILPELHNFVEQKIAHELKQKDLQVDDLRKRYSSLDLRCLELIAEKDVANRLIDELKALLWVARDAVTDHDFPKGHRYDIIAAEIEKAVGTGIRCRWCGKTDHESGNCQGFVVRPDHEGCTCGTRNNIHGETCALFSEKREGRS